MNCFSMVLKTSPMHMSFFNQIISSSNKYLTSFLKLRRNVRQVALFGARNFRELRNITVALFRAPSGGKPQKHHKCAWRATMKNSEFPNFPIITKMYCKIQNAHLILKINLIINLPKQNYFCPFNCRALKLPKQRNLVATNFFFLIHVCVGPDLKIWNKPEILGKLCIKNRPFAHLL